MATTSMLKKQNMLNLLNVVKRSGIISKPEIAKKTKLTNATVSNFINELLKKNIVIEEGSGDSKGGRKAVVYRFNDKAYYLIGVSLRSMGLLTTGLFDLGCNIIGDSIKTEFPIEGSVENIISLIIRDIKILIDNSGKKANEIIGIGITLPGRVNYKEGIIYNLTNLPQWINIPIKNLIESEIGITTFIERDTNSHISCLKWLNVTGNLSNVVYLAIGEGVGSGILINGQVYHGDHGLAGEVGHTSIDLDGPICNCGNNGCLEVLTSYKTILKYFIENYTINNLNYNSIDKNIIQDEITIDDLINYAKQGNINALKAFSKVSKYIGVGLLNIINTYDPSMIIIECKWLKQLRNYFNEIVTYVYENTKLIDRGDIKIILNPLDDIFPVAGAVVVLDHIFGDPQNNNLLL